jgi:hypothetical protein
MASSAERLVRGAQCANTNFRNADFGDSQWHSGTFIGCDFTGALLETGDFDGARVRDSSGVPARGGLHGASVLLKKQIPPQRRAGRLRPAAHQDLPPESGLQREGLD